jgi:2-methylcitrate dehydratase PrpD
VIESAKRHLLDTLGVGLMGATQPMPRNALKGISAIPGSAGSAHAWGSDIKLAPPYAAMANGISAHVLDFDDTHTTAIVHGSAIIAPTVLAIGEHLNASGRDILTAFVAGWEVAARVGLAAQGSMHQRGYHTSSVAGIFGAAAAAGKLLGLTQEQLTFAIGLAGSQASGINEYQSNGSSSKILHTGWAAYSGIVAAYLAQAGMTGPLTVFEGRLGFFNAYALRERLKLDELTAGLGERWETNNISIKPYSCCHFGHAFIDCAKQLSEKGLTPSDVEYVECVVADIQVAMVCEPAELKCRPDSPYAAKFSLPFMVAAALSDGKVGHETFSPENIARPDLLDLAGRVGYRVAAPNELTFPRYFPGWLRVKAKGGREFEERMDINLGTPENPMSQSAIEEKFRDNAGVAVDGAQTERLISSVAALERTNAVTLGTLMGLGEARGV